MMKKILFAFILLTFLNVVFLRNTFAQKTLSDCDLYFEGKDFYDTCLYKIAKKNQDPSICKKIQKIIPRRNCLYDIAKNKNDLSICDLDEDPNVRYKCYQDYGIEKLDIEVCRQIPIWEDEIPYSRDLCFMYVSSNTKNTEICNEIKSPQSRETCLMSEQFLEMFEVPAESVFKKFIADPIPDDVEILEGGGFAFQGHSVSITFTTSPKTFRKLSSEYQRLSDCSEEINTVLYDLRDDKNSRFEEDLMAIPNLLCFYKKMDDKIPGNSYMFWDQDSNKGFYCSSH